MTGDAPTQRPHRTDEAVNCQIPDATNEFTLCRGKIPLAGPGRLDPGRRLLWGTQWVSALAISEDRKPPTESGR